MHSGEVLTDTSHSVFSLLTLTANFHDACAEIGPRQGNQSDRHSKLSKLGGSSPPRDPPGQSRNLTSHRRHIPHHTHHHHTVTLPESQPINITPHVRDHTVQLPCAIALPAASVSPLQTSTPIPIPPSTLPLFHPNTVNVYSSCLPSPLILWPREAS